MTRRRQAGDRRADVLVIGGGPAGAAAASLLASWGRSVVLFHDDPRRCSLAESLPAGTRKLLDVIGVTERIDRARFYPNDGNVSAWAARPVRTTSDTPGYHVSRAAFDRVLRGHARAAGATLVRARVRGVKGEGPFRVESVDARGAAAIWEAAYLLDCSGRAGVVARRGFRRHDAPYRTMAVVAEWTSGGWPAADARHVFIESYRDGWAWSVPLSSRRRQCTVMIDPDRSQRRSGLQAIYAEELRKAAGLSARLRRARQLSPPWACDSSIYDASRTADSGLLLVGDAASFIEPLSSAGVRKALVSAWRAAVVVNTCIERPTMTGAACEFYDRRERLVHAECCARAATFFAMAAAAGDAEFWGDRAAFAPEPPVALDHELSDSQLRQDPQVRRAFERLRAAPDLRLRASAGVRFEPAAAIEGRHVVLRDAVVLPGATAAVRFAAGVELPALVRLADGYRDVPQIVDVYRAQVGPVEPGNVLASVSMLLARRLLMPVGSRADENLEIW